MARQSEKELYWRGVVRRWQRSGQTIRAFCDAHGVSEPSFYGWRRTIAERDQQQSADVPDFVPVRVTPVATMLALEVVAGPGRVVRVPTGFDADTFRRLLTILEEEVPSC